MNTSRHACRLGQANDLALLYDAGQQPIAHRFLTEKCAEQRRFPLALYVSQSTGLIQICEPIDPKVLYEEYNYCFSSWKPEPHMGDELRLLRSLAPQAKVFEIGCNDGRFMAELRDRGQPKCVGLEPNPFATKIARARGFEIFQEFLTENVCREIIAKHGNFELIVARQVLEHISDITTFFHCVHLLLADGGLLFVDVPDVEPGLGNGDITIIWEEHVNYFTEEVLRNAFISHGFSPQVVTKYDFSGGCLAVLSHKTKAEGKPQFPPRVRFPERGFSDRVERIKSVLLRRLEAARARGSKNVLYGTGCRACALVNILGLSGLLDFAVDDQSERQGKFMPGSKLEILPSSALGSGRDRYAVLLAVNCENEPRVCAKLTSQLSPDRLEFITALSPNSKQLLD